MGNEGINEIREKIFGIAGGAVLFVLTVVMQTLGCSENAITAGCFFAYVVAIRDVYLRVYRNVRKLKIFDEHFLIFISTIGAFLVGKYFEAVFVTLFFQIGKLLELFALERSKRSIAQFMDIKPQYANRKVGNQVITTEPQNLKVGQIILINPGDRIPVDAKVSVGSSMIDEKALTGEAMPREVHVGDTLYSGSINLEGVLEAKVTKAYQSSTVSRILDLVEKANEKKSENEYFVDKFTKYYTPIVMILAFLVMIVPPMTFAGDDLHTWVYRGLIVLVTAIPCGLIVSVPLAMFGGLGSAARQGILIKGYNFLEDLAKVDTFVFDKTGTLTEGVFVVSEIYPRSLSEDEMIRLMACAEAYSNHPIAHSLKEAYGKTIYWQHVKNVQEYSGYGVSATVQGREVLVGNSRFLANNGIATLKTKNPGTAVHLAVDGSYEGYVLITDRLRVDTADTIAELKKQQTLLVMLTGDNKKTAKAIGRELGMDYVFAELLPEDKVEQLEEFMAIGQDEEKLAFVGDGLNDAPVLARADIGIAMGGLGSDAAIEAADIVLMEDEPYRIIDAIRIAKETVRVVKQNMHFAVGIKIILLALATVGLVTMRTAIIADMAVLVINLLNSYWVLKFSE